MPRAPDRLANLRDVGGLPARGGRTRDGVLLRSDAPMPGDRPPDGVPWPPRIVLDLRGTAEATGPHPLAPLGAQVLSLPLSEEAALDELVDQIPDGLGQLYLQIVSGRGAELVRAAQTVAAAPGPVLVHCAAGKDRTGTLIAVLLAAVGVDPDAILEDYLETGPNMDAILARQVADPATPLTARDVDQVRAQRPELVDVSAPALRAVLEHLERAGGAAEWLRAQGLAPRELAALRSRLVAAA